MSEQIEKSTKKIPRKNKFLIGLGVAGTLLVGAAAASPQNIDTANTATKKPATITAVKSDKTETKQVAETQSVPFATQTVDDAALTKGQTKITQEGKDGVKTLRYNVTYTNNAETNRVLVSEEITTPSVTKIVHTGTYVPPSTPCSGGYINTYGNCIPSPSDNPSGATAQCVDGTYSYSQSRQGTCSHHGGVARWL